ncbi:MAG TPA: cytochrome c oxidase subunit II [Solirubrobacteraceae bacterium]|nr:cytochrome c oxidase subunit II [Solirubrobacteraceae bacterium]
MPSTTHAYTHVEHVYFPIAIGVFAVIVGALFVLLVLGARRASPGKRSEALKLESAYAIALAGVGTFLLWTTFRAEAPIDRTVASPGLRIHVVAAQWSWRLQYPDGVTIDAVSSWHPPAAAVPTGTEVEFTGTSADVIHGFWVPQLHFQRQLLPGYTTRFDLIFEHAGMYGGTCSVFCGDQHSQMHFRLQALAPARFRQWLAAQSAAQAATAPG